MNIIKLSVAGMLTIFLAVGCFHPYLPGSNSSKASSRLEADISEKAPDSLDLLVSDFKWSYFNDGAHLKVNGTVINTSGAPKQSVMITVQLYDERGKVIASGSSYIAPTYLVEGAEGTFEVTAMPKHSRMKYTRMVYSCKSSF